MFRKIAIVSLCVLAVAGCVSTPPQTPQKEVPAWVTTTPAPDATYTYFVGFGTDPSGNAANATEIASNKLVQMIMNYIGVKITSDTTATAKASLETYETALVSTLKSSATNQISGFTVAEKFIAPMQGSSQVQAYVLGKYITKDLEAEKKRIQDENQKKIDAVAVPEAEGKAFLSEGRPFDAVRKFAEAANAASKSDISNAAIFFEDNVNNAKGAVARVRFIVDKTPVQASLGQPFPAPFKGKVVFGESDSAPGIPGANIAISYPQKQASGRMIQKTENVMTDSSGNFQFTPPAPDYIGKQKIQFRVDLRDSLIPLRDVPSKFQNLKTAFTEAVNQKFVDVEFTVGSAAKTVSTGVAIVDLDEADGFVPGANCQAGLLETLTKEKFKVKAVAVDRNIVMGLDDDAIVAAAKANFGAQIERLAYGTAKLESVRKDGPNFVATAVATVKVVDLKSGETLYTKQATTMSVDATEDGAKKAAYRDLGKSSVGRDMANNLP